MQRIKHPIRQSHTIRRLLDRMPQEVADSFTDEQLIELNKSMGGRSWAKHKLDIRGTVKWWRSSYYFVFLAGRNVRKLSRFEQQLSRFTLALLSTLVLLFCICVGLLAAYLIKSALGINLFDGFSLGIWSWFKENIL